MQYFVYILASKRNGTLYIWVTWDLVRRISEHRNELYDGFTKQYNIHMLVWYESFGDILEAIRAEKRMKKWKREYKIKLIEERNPEWRDLFEEIIQ